MDLMLAKGCALYRNRQPILLKRQQRKDEVISYAGIERSKINFKV